MCFQEERAFAETVHDSTKRGGIIERYGSPHNPLKRFLDGGNSQKGICDRAMLGLTLCNANDE